MAFLQEKKIWLLSSYLFCSCNCHIIYSRIDFVSRYLCNSGLSNVFLWCSSVQKLQEHRRNLIQFFTNESATFTDQFDRFLKNFGRFRNCYQVKHKWPKRIRLLLWTIHSVLEYKERSYVVNLLHKSVLYIPILSVHNVLLITYLLQLYDIMSLVKIKPSIYLSTTPSWKLITYKL